MESMLSMDDSKVPSYGVSNQSRRSAKVSSQHRQAVSTVSLRSKRRDGDSCILTQSAKLLCHLQTYLAYAILQLGQGQQVAHLQNLRLRQPARHALHIHIEAPDKLLGCWRSLGNLFFEAALPQIFSTEWPKASTACQGRTPSSGSTTTLSSINHSEENGVGPLMFSFSGLELS